MASGAASSPLMELPGEIRNRIYRFAVVEPEGTSINIRATSLQEPGLLTTCKAIRAEAGPLFFAENTFRLHLRNCCCAASCFWASKKRLVVKEFGICMDSIKTRHSGNAFTPPSWQNLLKWMRHSHERPKGTKLRSPEDMKARGDTSLRRAVIGRMFCTIDAMRDKPWVGVEKLLLQDRVILELIDAAWTA